MCGRYAITSAPEAIRALFGYGEEPDFPPRYNVAPTQPIPVVRLSEGRRSFALVRWGLMPPWVKDPRTFSLLINARGESVLDKPAFRNAMRRRRCLVPADGFYEWKADGARKRPYFIRPVAGGPIAFAGLWECWTGPNGEEVETACVVTTAANRSLRPLHDRMPVVIPPAAFDLWLDCANVEAETAAALIAPAPETFFSAHEVATAVNRTANDTPDLIAPLAEPPPDTAPPSSAPARKRARASAKPKANDDQGSLF